MSNGAALNMQWVFSDPQVRPFSLDQRVDLLAGNTTQVSTGVYIVYSKRAAKGQIDIVRGIAPYVQRRTDVGTPDESFETIPPAEADGNFTFNPLVDRNSPIVIKTDYNAPRIAAGPLNNDDRQERPGITHMSSSPWVDSERYSFLFSIPVPSQAIFEVTFEILPPATAAGIPNPFSIGAAANRRVDFAGVRVSGVTMPQAMYDRLREQEQSGGLS